MFDSLFCLVGSQEWDRVVTQVAAHPSECKKRNSRRMTPLHAVCERDDPPVRVVSALLGAYPEAALAQDDCGLTPLHAACHANASHEVVERLLRANIGAVFIRNRRDHTALTLLCHWYKTKLKRAIRLTEDRASHDVEAFRHDPDFASIWIKGILLVKAAAHGTVAESLSDGRKWRVVHACSRVRDCPADLLRFALRLHPNQVREEDEDGYLPLDLAIASGRKWDGGFIALLDAFPAAVTRIDPQSHLYPFMVASIGNGASLDTVYHLFRQCPELERCRGTSMT